VPIEAGHIARQEMEIPMKGMVLAALIAVGATASIASVGIRSLADGAAVLINASSHSGAYVNATYSPGER
jgi:hypothetical protein